MEAILAPKGPLMFRTFFSGRTISRKDPLCLSTEVPDLEATENLRVLRNEGRAGTQQK